MSGGFTSSPSSAPFLYRSLDSGEICVDFVKFVVIRSYLENVRPRYFNNIREVNVWVFYLIDKDFFLTRQQRHPTLGIQASPFVQHSTFPGRYSHFVVPILQTDERTEEDDELDCKEKKNTHRYTSIVTKLTNSMFSTL